MEIEEIKRMFFQYNCRLSFLLRDMNIDEDITNVIIENEKEWTNEFFKIKKREIVEAKTFSDFAEAYARYKSACKSYYDIYELSIIIKDVFLEERFFMEATFIYYYDLIMGKSIVSKEMASYDNLINYLKNNDMNNYNKLVSEIEEVFSKETDALSDHCKELKVAIINYINKYELIDLNDFNNETKYSQVVEYFVNSDIPNYEFVRHLTDDRTELHSKKCLWRGFADILVKRGLPRIKDVIKEMLMWYQDGNWPGFLIIHNFINENKDKLIDEINDAYQEALSTNDYSWIEYLEDFLEVHKTFKRK